MLALNCGSGQRRFGAPFINIDCISRPPDQVPDVIADLRSLPYPGDSAQIIVLHHVLEHFHLTAGASVLRECHRVLAPNGSLLIFIPDLRALSIRWLTGGIDDYIFFVNTYGAYQSQEVDFHRWGYTEKSLRRTLEGEGQWREIKPFDWRPIQGADIARDFWILGLEATK